MTRTTRIATTLAVAATAAATLFLGSCGTEQTQSDSNKETGRQSIIILAVDGLGTEALGCYGGEAATPNIDAFAGQSVLFTQAWTQAPSSPSAMASILTGLYPTTHGLVEAGDILVDDAATLAERLSAAGFATAAFVHGAAGDDPRGLNQGFAQYTPTADPATDGLNWLEQQGSGAVFLLLQPESTDAGIGSVLDALAASGRMASSSVVLVSTTGPTGGFEGPSLSPVVTRVPMMIHQPGGAGKTVDTIVETLDLMPTLLEAVGTAGPQGLQGGSLSAIINGTSNPPYIAFSEYPVGDGLTSVVMNGMQLVAAGESRALYDLAADPTAQTDLAEQFPERVKVLEEHREAWSKMVAAASLDPERRSEDLDDETLDQLRSLGYIQ